MQSVLGIGVALTVALVPAKYSQSGTPLQSAAAAPAASGPAKGKTLGPGFRPAAR